MLERKSESESHSVVSNSLRPHGLYSPWNSPGHNTGLSLLQGIFLTQGLNPGLRSRHSKEAGTPSPAWHPHCTVPKRSSLWDTGIPVWVPWTSVQGESSGNCIINRLPQRYWAPQSPILLALMHRAAHTWVPRGVMHLWKRVFSPAFPFSLWSWSGWWGGQFLGKDQDSPAWFTLKDGRQAQGMLSR